MAKKKLKAKAEKREKPTGTLLERLRTSTSGRAIAFRPAVEVVSTYSLRRPTGILSLDLALRGGLPAGTVTQLFGPDGAGKDYLFNAIAAQTQRIYDKDSKIFTSSFGYSWDKTAMLMAGVYLPFCDELAQEGIGPDHPKYGKQLKNMGELIEVAFEPEEFSPDDDIGPAESTLTGVVACVATGEFQLGLINELPAAETQIDAEAQLGADKRYSPLARVMADFQRKYFQAMKAVHPNETTLIVINQVRANIGATYGKQTTEPCGFALKHMKAVDIHLQVVARVKEAGENGAVIGKRVRFEISKGKCGLSEGGQGEFDFLFYEGADILKDLIDVVVRMDLLHLSGSWYSLLDGTRIGQGISQTKEFLRGRPDLVRQLRAEAYKMSGLEGIRFR